MAVVAIAGASCAGKSAFDRACILIAAHATARQRMATSRAWRSYRQAFADALRREWMWAKQRAAQAEMEAEAVVTLPPDVIARCSALRLEASYEPQTFAGHARFRALSREADEIAQAALSAMSLTKKGYFHVAH